MRLSSEEKSTDLPFIAERSKRPNTSEPTGKHHVFTHVQNDTNCEFCKTTNTTRTPCKNRPDARGDRVQHAQNYGDATTTDHKVLNEENESRLHHRCAVVSTGPLLLLDPRFPNGATKLLKRRWANWRNFGSENQVLLIQIVLWDLSVLLKTMLASRQVNPIPIKNHENCRTRSPWSLLVQSGFLRKVVERSNGMLVSFCETYTTNWQTEGCRMKQDVELHLMVH